MYPTESQNTKRAGTPFPTASGPSIDPAGQPSGPRISIVIPTFNRGVQLQVCLDALSRGFPPDAETIVVSDGGDRAAFPDLSRFEKTLNLRVVHAEHGGPAHARNRGLEHARAPIVAFIDDDCLPQSGWLDRIAGSVALDPPTAAGGITLNGLPENVWSAAAQLILDMGERDQRERNYDPVFYPTNNIAFPTESLRGIGGFDSAFRTSEDREVCRRWLQAGYRLVKAPDAVLAHAPQLDLARFWQRCAAYGSGAAQFHGSSGQPWHRESLAFHARVPCLAAAETRHEKLRRRVAIFAVLLLWELANLLGFIKQTWYRGQGRQSTPLPNASKW